MWKWLLGIIQAIRDYRQTPSFNFNPGPETPEIPIDPNVNRPGQPKIHK